MTVPSVLTSETKYYPIEAQNEPKFGINESQDTSQVALLSPRKTHDEFQAPEVEPPVIKKSTPAAPPKPKPAPPKKQEQKSFVPKDPPAPSASLPKPPPLPQNPIKRKEPHTFPAIPASKPIESVQPSAGAFISSQSPFEAEKERL